jgi:4-diphosphocytidyl-2-C-methyl-D-erythritol kinase
MIIEKFGDGFRVTVPCKVNLFLEVLGKRDDGYHSLDTVMMAVSLVDELEITHREDDQLRLKVEFPAGYGHPLDDADLAWEIPTDQRNLVIKALERLRVACDRPHAGANVKLIKRIPALAGLGGGSADAAAALVLGVLLWSNADDCDLACVVASEIGSDINFFLQSHRAGNWLARCTGRGEQIECLDANGKLNFVVVHPPRGCSTKEVFSALELNSFSPRSPGQLIQALNLGEPETIGQELFNRLEAPAMCATEWIDGATRRLNRYSHRGQCLSGSGSARFCLCSSHEEAEKIASELMSQGEMRAYCAQSWHAPGIEEQIARIRNNT